MAVAMIHDTTIATFEGVVIASRTVIAIYDVYCTQTLPMFQSFSPVLPTAERFQGDSINTAVMRRHLNILLSTSGTTDTVMTLINHSQEAVCDGRPCTLRSPSRKCAHHPSSATRSASSSALAERT